MAQTFRTDPETGRTVISQDNVVGRQMASGERVDNRISDGGASVSDVRRGYESMNAPTRPGTGYMSRSEFESLSGMTDTNPYGNDGFFSRVFGIDPSKIDYTNNLGPRGIENVKRQAYDRFTNPFAKVDAFGRPTMFADASAGTTRRGVRPGDLTIFGPAVESRPEPFEGIGALLNDTMIGRLANPPRTRIPGYDANILLPDLMEGPAVGGGTEPPGVPYFTSSTNPPLAPDAPSMEDIKAARDARNAVPTTVAEVIAAAPMATEPLPEQVVAGSVPVNPGKSIIPVPETENERIMRERQEAFDAAMRRRQQESSAFMDRTNETLDEILRRGDTIVTPGVRGGAIEPLASDLLNPQNIREVLQLAGRDSTRPFPIEIIPEALLAGSR